MRMRARSLARRLALALGLPLAALGSLACKSDERPGQRPDRAPPASAAADHEARCERGTFCVPPQATMEVAAPPPFARCSVIHPLPEGVPAGWEPARRAKLRIRFHGDTTAAARAQDPETCCYEWWEHCAGRPLREGNRVIVAEALPASRPPAAGPRDVRRPLPRDVATGRATAEDRARAIAAEHWVKNGLLEHASVAAFGRVALDLLTLGAPADLVAGAHAAALDELRHTELSFSLAAELGASVSGPGPLPAIAGSPRPCTPDVLLRETFRDGCLGEAAAGLVLSAAARRARADIAATLETMAADEAHHAELAWRTARWLAETFEEAAAALREEVESLRAASPGAAILPRKRRPALAARLGVWSPDDMDDARAGARSIALPLAARLLQPLPRSPDLRPAIRGMDPDWPTC